MQTTSDEVLISRIAGGDRLAMQVLYARHHVRVYRFVLRLVSDGGRLDQRGVPRRRRVRLTRIESQTFQLSNSTFYRWRIPDSRSAASIVRALEGNRLVASAQLSVRASREGRRGWPGLRAPKDTCDRSAVLPIVTIINR
jgi:hypothetical protein